MRKKTRTLALGLAALVLVFAAPHEVAAQDEAAADLTGTWAISIESPQGVFESSWVLEQHEDGTVTGTMTVPQMAMTIDITDGWIDGTKFEFLTAVDAQGQMFEIIYTGTVEGDELAGLLDAAGGQFQADFFGTRDEGAGGVR